MIPAIVDPGAVAALFGLVEWTRLCRLDDPGGWRVCGRSIVI